MKQELAPLSNRVGVCIVVLFDVQEQAMNETELVADEKEDELAPPKPNILDIFE